MKNQIFEVSSICAAHFGDLMFVSRGEWGWCELDLQPHNRLVVSITGGIDACL